VGNFLVFAVVSSSSSYSYILISSVLFVCFWNRVGDR
jgi:hypothetical protein